MSGGGQPLYDSIGTSYQTTRRADAAIVSALAAHLGLCTDGRYLDLGCGSGNYTRALAARGGPQLYLDAGVRANISSFARLCPKDELEQGLAALRADLAAGRFDSDAGPSAGEAGDYAFVIARVAA